MSEAFADSGTSVVDAALVLGGRGGRLTSVSWTMLDEDSSGDGGTDDSWPGPDSDGLGRVTTMVDSSVKTLVSETGGAG